ncbi:hypothetical protein SAMN04515671_3004 [Nakamurella panacisegetis]|uniref:Uncharacterized protein n=1 Tax=Nakamurella panacisegetis TaxID=1090615 RepID=A0A1H0Q796_9ACTN|nr:hypothetical protein [Nakamurella panacisegetis]SDP12905.1 hypothetical protein SAMN04515671_3004 [Nakamurella panacisegetis]
MAESRMRRAAQAMRDPWSLLATAVGVGAAWALAFPVVGIGAVGVGMLGVAAVVGAGGAGRDDQPDPKDGTDQRRMVATLDSYRADLVRFRDGQVPPLLVDRAAEAVQAADAARAVALGVAASLDRLDSALLSSRQVATTMSTAARVAGPVGRMTARRTEMLGKLGAAVDGVGELYAKLLELSTAPEVTGGLELSTGMDPVADVSEALDSIRGAFAELDAVAKSTTDG